TLHRLKPVASDYGLKPDWSARWRTLMVDAHQVTLKSSSGSGAIWFLIYSAHTSSVTFPLWRPNILCPINAGPNNACATRRTRSAIYGSSAPSDTAQHVTQTNSEESTEAYARGLDLSLRHE